MDEVEALAARELPVVQQALEGLRDVRALLGSAGIGVGARDLSDAYRRLREYEAWAQSMAPAVPR